MLRQEQDIIVVGDAHTGELAVATLQETSIDVVLLGVRLPGMDGIETLNRIKPFLPTSCYELTRSFIAQRYHVNYQTVGVTQWP